MTQTGPDHAGLVAAARAWRDEDPDPATRAEVDDLLGRDDVVGLADRFGSRLQFGTAGLRGRLGAGPNRMNRAIVRRTSAGVAAWLRAGGGATAVVARDARHRSAEFAEDAAAVLSASGIDVFLLPRPVPTPLLAFAVRHLAADAGVMITASHNPRDDNGYKLYSGGGAQIVPPADRAVSAAIDAVGSLGDIPCSRQRVRSLDDDLFEAYLDAVVGLLDRLGPRQVRVVHTALHGVATETVLGAFELAAFPSPITVVEQADPDPDFPTVAFPNPEEPGALDLAIARAREVDADLVLANDPDGDRLGVAVPEREGPHWRALTGDELGTLLADHLLSRQADPQDVMVTTVVSSRALSKLAAAAGVGYAETLTGFKWIVRAAGRGQRFRFGYEEALGYCVGEVVRDKDGIGAALVVAEMAADRKARGSNLLERLDQIWLQHGVHVTGQRSLRVGGAGWLERVAAAMASLRSDPPLEVGGRRTQHVEDLLEGSRLPSTDGLVLDLVGARLVVRPSGTEPKLKCYAEAVVEVDGGDVEAARSAASAAVDDVLVATEALLRQRGV